MLGEKPVPELLCPHRPHMDWPGIETEPPFIKINQDDMFTKIQLEAETEHNLLPLEGPIN
jgi:hypothetical protein